MKPPPVSKITSSQRIFLTLASLENASIRAGFGMAKRFKTDLDEDIAYSANYAAMKRSMQQGGLIDNKMAQLRTQQASLREGLEKEIKQALKAEARYS